MTRFPRTAALLLFLPLLLPAPARAQSCLVDISEYLVPITTGFAGSSVFIFGTIERMSDLVLTVQGPPSTIEMFRKSRIAGIWINTAKMSFNQAPSFFAIAANRPLGEIAAESELRLHQMGVEHIVDLPPAKASPNVRDTWKQALIRNMQRKGLYATGVESVAFPGPTLFRARIQLPANVPTGEYKVSAFCLVDGKVQGARTVPLSVSKIGVEAEIFDFAHNLPLIYGVIAVILALVAGWLAHVVFRRP